MSNKSEVHETEMVLSRDDPESNHATNHFLKQAHPNNFRISSTNFVNKSENGIFSRPLGTLGNNIKCVMLIMIFVHDTH